MIDIVFGILLVLVGVPFVLFTLAFLGGIVGGLCNLTILATMHFVGWIATRKWGIVTNVSR